MDKIRIFFKDSWNDLISVSQDNLILVETENDDFFKENNRCLAKKKLNSQRSKVKRKSFSQFDWITNQGAF